MLNKASKYLEGIESGILDRAYKFVYLWLYHKKMVNTNIPMNVECYAVDTFRDKLKNMGILRQILSDSLRNAEQHRSVVSMDKLYKALYGTDDEVVSQVFYSEEESDMVKENDELRARLQQMEQYIEQLTQQGDKNALERYKAEMKFNIDKYKTDENNKTRKEISNKAREGQTQDRIRKNDQTIYMTKTGLAQTALTAQSKGINQDDVFKVFEKIDL